MSPVMKEDSDCFLTVSFHIRRMRLCGDKQHVKTHHTLTLKAISNTAKKVCTWRFNCKYFSSKRDTHLLSNTEKAKT